jgi:hypothetical protein
VTRITNEHCYRSQEIAAVVIERLRMPDIGELVQHLPTETQNQLYEKVALMDDAERERFAEEIARSLARYQHAMSEEARAAREARQARAPKVGQLAPDFDLATLEGDRRVSLQELRGRPVGLIFGSYT